MWEVVGTILKQLFLNPATNKFPAKYAPASTTDFLSKVAKGEAKLVPPVPVPPNFRGKIAYDRETCSGCRLCLRVCPTKAIEFLTKEKKVKIFISRCCFCSQCVEICPVNCLAMTGDFLLSSYDKYAEGLVITDTGSLKPQA